MNAIPDQASFQLLPGVSFDELNEKHCRWPLGASLDRAERFCGDPKVIGRYSFCAFHMKRAFIRGSHIKRV